MSSPPLDTLPCAACNRPVFAGGNVVLCARCDAYQHKACWVKRGACAAAAKCKGKPVHVAVVRLEPPHPTSDDVSAIVLARVNEVVHPLVADLRSVVAHSEDLTALRRTIEAQAAAARADAEQARRAIEGRIDELRRLVVAMDDRERTAPVPIVREDLTAQATQVAERTAGSVAELRTTLTRELESLRTAVGADLHGVLVAIEACRWDTAARRHALPWDDRTDDVLAPAARTGEE